MSLILLSVLVLFDLAVLLFQGYKQNEDYIFSQNTLFDNLQKRVLALI